MAEVYDAVDKDILPFLRKAEITIKSYLPKKTREDIVLLSTTNPSELTVEELLYSATLEENLKHGKFIDIYGKVIELHEDWRAYNNLAAMLYIPTILQSPGGSSDELLKASKELLEKANSLLPIGTEQDEININLGILASLQGNLDLAEEFFNKGNASNHNKATLSLRQGNYRSASRYYRGQNTYNAALVNILNGDYNSICTENTAACYYLNAIAGARAGNESILFTNLEKAISKDDSYKVEVTRDLEFVNFREHEKFISLTK